MRCSVTAAGKTLLTFAVSLSVGTAAGQAPNEAACPNFGGSLWIAGSPCYADIETALNAAGAQGWVLIPRAYKGTDTYAAGTYKNVIDLRGNFFGVYQYIAPSRPLRGYPLGGDLALDVDGPADLVLTRDNMARAVAATRTSIAAGATQDITVRSTANFSGSAGYVWAGRETPAQEECILNSIVSATVLRVTCKHDHSGTTDIEQIGNLTIHNQRGWILSTEQPAQLTAYTAPLHIGTNQIYLMDWPMNAGDPFPHNAIRVSVPITGMGVGGAGGPLPTAADLVLQDASASNCIRLNASTGATNLLACDDQLQVAANLLPASGGMRSLGDSGHVWAGVWVGKNAAARTEIVSRAATANSTLAVPDGNSQSVLTGTVTTTASATDAITVPGLQKGGHCVFSPQGSASAAANLASAYYTIPSENTFELTHAAVAGMVFTVMCTAQ